MSKQPFLPLFFGDFSASTAEWRGEEASLYLTLLGHQWAIGSLPADPEKLCRLVRWDRKLFNQCWPTVSTKFEPVGEGRLGNSRLEDHRERAKELAKKNADAGRKGAESRWHKDGERHSPAIVSPLTPANGVTNSNPSHPIPTHKKKEEQNHVELKLDGGPVDRIFLHWQEVWQKPKAKLDPKRRRVIQQALANYTEPDLIACINGYRSSPHHTGENERRTVYDEISLFLRDAAHIDAGIAFNKPKGNGHAKPELTFRSEREFAAYQKATAEGRSFATQAEWETYRG
jgi:uncharacterized protein YdaU (DUF1376 family)